MPVHLAIENETSLPDGGPLTFTITGKRGIDIGRDSYLDWTLPDENRAISGKHCEIRYRDGGYWLHDVSRNGTFLNRSTQRLQEACLLRDGDRIEIGRYVISVRIDEGAVEPPQSERRIQSAAPAAQYWDEAGDAAPPISRRDLRPARELRPVQAEFSEWAIDVPAPVPGGIDAFSEYPPPARHGDPSSGVMDWAQGPSFAPPPPEPVSPLPSPRRPSPFGPAEPGPAGFRDGSASPNAGNRSPVPDGPNPPVATSPWDAPETQEPPFPAVPASRSASPWEDGDTSLPARMSEPAPAPRPAPVETSPPAVNPAAWTEEPPAPAFRPAPVSAETRDVDTGRSSVEQPVGPDRAPRAGAISPDEFLARLAKGAGVPPELLAWREAGDWAEELGALLRLTSDSLKQLLAARTEAKRVVRAGSYTTIEALDNNPLKFSPTIDIAMKTMLGPSTSGYLDARRTLEQSFKDVKVHEVKTYSAMQHAIRMLMEDLDPGAIEESSNGGSGLGGLLGSKKAKLWDIYAARWDTLTSPHEDGIVDAFLMFFAECYDRKSRG